MAGRVGRPIRLSKGVLRADGRPLVMGILNVTPDSFSDGGRYDRVDRAVSHATRLLAEGADVLDVGGESTRPGAAAVDPATERERVVPVIEALRDAGVDAVLSVDTRRAAVADAALAAGADLVNDVSAFADADMPGVVASHGAAVVLMHMRGVPATMQRDVRYDDVVASVHGALRAARDAAGAAGIDRDRIVLDPGLGFGKRTGAGIEDNCVLLSALPRFHELGCAVLVGASRKTFLGSLTGRPVGERLAGSLTAAVAAAWAGADVLRVHDVAATVDAVQVARAIDPSAWGAFWAPGSAAPNPVDHEHDAV